MLPRERTPNSLVILLKPVIIGTFLYQKPSFFVSLIAPDLLNGVPIGRSRVLWAINDSLDRFRGSKIGLCSGLAPPTLHFVSFRKVEIGFFSMHNRVCIETTNRFEPVPPPKGDCRLAQWLGVMFGSFVSFFFFFCLSSYLNSSFIQTNQPPPSSFLLLLFASLHANSVTILHFRLDGTLVFFFCCIVHCYVFIVGLWRFLVCVLCVVKKTSINEILGAISFCACLGDRILNGSIAWHFFFIIFYGDGRCFKLLKVVDGPPKELRGRQNLAQNQIRLISDNIKL